MDAQTWQAQQFESHRERLRGVAQRMLGSASEADDAVQEAWLRLTGSEAGAIENLGGWLTTVVGRICLDMLRSRSARREDPLGEPLLTFEVGDDPAEQAQIADAVGLALLVVLDTLAPAERVAFVLHDMFGVPFDEIAPIVDRTPAATRQLASRARRRVRGAAPAPDVDLARQREVVSAFLAAASSGDFDALVAVLDPEVVFLSVDAAGHAPRRRAAGAPAVARELLARGTRFAPQARPAIVNGTAGAYVGNPEAPLAVVGFTVVGDRIAAVDLFLNPRGAAL